MVDLFESPEFLLSPEFDPYKCSVLGIKLNDSADELKDWEGELNSANWFHVEGGVAFHVKDHEIFKIKLPRTIFAQLEIRTIEDLIEHLGKHDDVQEMKYRDRLHHRNYLWNKGVDAFWQILPKLEPQSITIFDPSHGYERRGEMTYKLPLARDCLERHPSFQIPPQEESENLKPGDLAKMMFDIEIDSKSFVERMWVEVEEVKPEFYQGHLINDAFCTHDLKRGETVQFHADHVIQIMRKEARE